MKKDHSTQQDVVSSKPTSSKPASCKPASCKPAGCKPVSFEAAKKDRDAEWALLEKLLGEDYVRALQPARSAEPTPIIPLR